MTQETRQTTAAPGTEPAPALLPVIFCRDCRHWDRRWPKANHAQCLQATKYASGGGVLLTTDLTTCSQAQPR